MPVLEACHGQLRSATSGYLLEWSRCLSIIAASRFMLNRNDQAIAEKSTRCGALTNDCTSKRFKQVKNTLQQVFGQRGFIGVESQNFDLIFII